MRDMESFTAGPDDADRRLDRVLRRLLPELALSAIYGALRRGDIRLNGGKARPEARIAEGDRLEVARTLASVRAEARAPAGAIAGGDGRQDAPPTSSATRFEELLILETADLVFLSKPRGLESHGTAGLDSLVAGRLAAGRPASLSFSPGPLHRLDRNTSGLIAFPASAAGARAFTAALREGLVTKRYLALLSGPPPREGAWRDRLVRDETRLRTRRAEAADPEAREARAYVWPLREGRIGSLDLCLALVELETGFTHQIRIQASLRGHPLAGDGKYGGPPLPASACPAWSSAPGAPRGGGYLLHAWRLGFKGAIVPGLPPELEAEPPRDARALLELAFGEAGLAAALEAGRESSRTA